MSLPLRIPFNIPYVGEAARLAVQEVMKGQTFAGGGPFTKRCLDFFSQRYGFKQSFLTSSCTDALEMCGMLLDLKPGDEVIVPAYTYVTSALAFHRQGAKIVFADSRSDHPNLDLAGLQALITPRTRAIVTVHYAGMADHLPDLVEFCRNHDLFLIEDAAQAIDGYFAEQPIGSFGHLACLSFHDTKNIHCGEGGLLIVNDERFAARAQILLDKGTNRSDFRRGLVPKYECVDIGSSFLASELQAAFLYGQLQELDDIQAKRQTIWERYAYGFQDLPKSLLPQIPQACRHNAHCYYLTLPESIDWPDFSNAMASRGIAAVTHYQALHESPYFAKHHRGGSLARAERLTHKLIRLPLYLDLQAKEQDEVIEAARKILETILP